MNPAMLQELLESVAAGQTPVGDALARLQNLYVEDIEYAHIDHHRSLRKGFPEVIFGQSKNAAQIAGIMDKMVRHEEVVLVTRIDADKGARLQKQFPQAVYHETARMLVWQKDKPPVTGRGTVLVLSAGTSDIPVAEEALITCRVMGNRTEGIFDVGVSGIHRLLKYRRRIHQAAVIVVVAGMEGALPSVVAGMVGCPVIAVPTSVGYGASLGGLAALFAMLNSCSSNVAVVNIDNGFGAGYMAAVINRA